MAEVRSYAGSDIASARTDDAALAIELSNAGLTSIIAQVKVIMVSTDIETLAFAFGAMQYAMTVRQFVANVMQDGPLGAPGLHGQIKEAADLLYGTETSELDFGLFGPVEIEVETELVGEIDNRIVNGISQESPRETGESGFNTQIFQTVARITTTSENTEHSQLNSVAQEGAFRTGIFGEQTYWAPTESIEEFNARVASREAELRSDVIERDRNTLYIEGLKATANAAQEYLTPELSDASKYEQGSSGMTDGDDVLIGTSLADYLSGRQRDDELSGGTGGPDALSGGAGNDMLRGGDLNDMMRGGAGSDMIIAGDTIGQMGTSDVARFEGLSSDYVIDGGTTYATVTSLIDGSRDKVFGVEFLRFDKGVRELGTGSALDDAGEVEDFVTAESVALLYEAALNRSNGDGIDRSGLNFYIDVAEDLKSERGFTQQQTNVFIAEDLMTSPEFTENFGNVNTLTNEDFLERVYENVLDRTPDSSGYAFYLELLNRAPNEAGYITKQEALADIAISPENTQGSTDVLMSLYEASTPELHPTTGIMLDWYFVA